MDIGVPHIFLLNGTGSYPREVKPEIWGWPLYLISAEVKNVGIYNPMPPIRHYVVPNFTFM
jgi:hypothetical protein